MWTKLTISAIVALGISNLAATRSEATIYSPGMGKPGLALRQATTTVEPIRVRRHSASRSTSGVRSVQQHTGTQRQGTPPTQQQRQGTPQ
jgi:hypothetical protein